MNEEELQLKTKPYWKKMYLFVFCQLSFFLSLCLFLYFTYHIINLSEIDIILNTSTPNWAILGIVILTLDFIFASFFFYLPWIKISSIQKNFYGDNPDYKKRLQKNNLIYVVAMVLFAILLLIFQETKGILNLLLFWIIFDLAGFLFLVIMYFKKKAF